MTTGVTSTDNVPTNFSELIGNDVKSNDFKFSVIYNWTICQKWKLYADLNYNLFKTDNHNAYSMNETLLNDVYSTHKKNYYKGTVDAVFSPNDRLSVDFGYSATWALYRFGQRNIPVTKSDENRHNVFSYLDYTLNDKLSGRVGLAFESIHISDKVTSNIYNQLLPAASLNFVPSQNVQVSADYSTRMEYPKLYQLSRCCGRISSWRVFISPPSMLSATIIVM